MSTTTPRKSRAKTVASEQSPAYDAPTQAELIAASEEGVIRHAIDILDRRMRKDTQSMGNPRDSATYCRLRLHGRVAESFCVMWLDNRHRVLAWEELFQGTIDGASVHPREVVRAALKWNAAAVIFAHNHPSGVAEPSAADRAITHELRDVLQLVGVRVLDHLVCGEGEPVSMASRGLI